MLRNYLSNWFGNSISKWLSQGTTWVMRYAFISLNIDFSSDYDRFEFYCFWWLLISVEYLFNATLTEICSLFGWHNLSLFLFTHSIASRVVWLWDMKLWFCENWGLLVTSCYRFHTENGWPLLSIHQTMGSTQLLER